MGPCGHCEALVTGAEQTARGGWPGSWKEGGGPRGGLASHVPWPLLTDGLEWAGADGVPAPWNLSSSAGPSAAQG